MADHDNRVFPLAPAAAEAAAEKFQLAISEASIGLGFADVPRRIFLFLYIRELLNTKKDPLDLTLRDLRRIGEDAAHHHAEYLISKGGLN
jgi:hypothetical protein